MRSVFGNLDFSEGTVGSAPAVWLLGPEWFMKPHDPIYEAKVVSGAACNGSQRCATVRSLRSDPSVALSFLYQVVDASKFRGKHLTFRADVKAEGLARLLVRVHRIDCSTSFRDDMGNHPITSPEWSAYQIHAPIDDDALDIEFGMQLVGEGAATIDHISMEFADAEP